MKEVVGKLDAKGLSFGIVVSRFNDMVTERLLQGAVQFLVRCGARSDDLTVVRVPGSFEIPFATRRLAATRDYDALICLGTLIRGETDHYEYLASEVTRGIAQVSAQYDLPISYGIVTADSAEQALDRAGLKQGNKGADAALSAIELANLAKELKSEPAG